MRLTAKIERPVTLITVAEDRIDAAAAVEFKDAFRAAIAGDGGAVVLDLSAVGFLDSSGLGAVVAARKLLGDDRALELAALQPPVMRVMQLTRMDQVFRIHDTVAEALALHRSSAA